MRLLTPDPRRKAVELLEYVMESEGADHLKMRQRFLNRFQRCLIDVALFLVGCSLLFFVAARKLFSLAKRTWLYSFKEKVE